MNWSDFDDRLRGEHLQGKTFVLTIREVTIEETHPRQGITQESPVLYFVETKKGLVLSPTNRRFLASTFGDDVRACIGKRVALHAVPMQVGGRATTPIRLSAAPQQPAATPPPSAPAPESPPPPPAPEPHDAAPADPDDADETEPDLDELEPEDTDDGLPVVTHQPVTTENHDHAPIEDPNLTAMRQELAAVNAKLFEAGLDLIASPPPGSSIDAWEQATIAAYQRLQAARRAANGKTATPAPPAHKGNPPATDAIMLLKIVNDHVVNRYTNVADLQKSLGVKGWPKPTDTAAWWDLYDKAVAARQTGATQNGLPL